jgi:hypothetical protein
MRSFIISSIIRMIKSRRVSWEVHVARLGEKRNTYRILVGKPGGKNPLGKPRHMSEGNIKMHLREIGLSDMDWIDLGQDRNKWRAFVNAVMNHEVPIKCWEIFEQLSDWRLLKKESAPWN